MRDGLPAVEHITGRFYLRGSLVVSRGNTRSSFDVRASHPDHRHLEKTLITRGYALHASRRHDHTSRGRVIA